MFEDSAIAFGVDEAIIFPVCGLCGKMIVEDGCRHHIIARSQPGSSDADWNREDRHSLCERAAHILCQHEEEGNGKGNPTEEQWQCYWTLVERFIALNHEDPGLKQVSSLASLARKNEFDHTRVTDDQLKSHARKLIPGGPV